MITEDTFVCHTCGGQLFFDPRSLHFKHVALFTLHAPFAIRVQVIVGNRVLP